MKLSNCGRCGLEPEIEKKNGWARCPVHGTGLWADPITWNAAQFAARTERINAAAVEICAAASPNATFEMCVLDAEELIAMQDIRSRSRWAEMQEGQDADE